MEGWKPACDCVVSLQFTIRFLVDCDIIEYKKWTLPSFESPIALLPKKYPICFVENVNEMVQMQIVDASQEEFIRFVHNYSNCKTRNINHLTVIQLQQVFK